MIQPMQFNSITRPFVNRKTVKQSHYTCSTILEVQNCKSTIQSALVFFFLSKYIKKSQPSHSDTRTQKHITVLRQYQFQLMFEQELEKKEQRHQGWIGTQGATINQLYQSLMESSQWQNGNYSTGCVMFAWHLFCH